MRNIDIYEVTSSLARAYAQYANAESGNGAVKKTCYSYALRQVITHDEFREFDRQLKSKSNSLDYWERTEKFIKELFRKVKA